MKLHQFLSDHREELLQICLRNLKRDDPDKAEEETGEHLRAYIDEVACALRRADGVPENLPGAEPRPAEVARDRHRRGFRIDHLVTSYTALSVAVGELGGHLRLAFGAEEYGVFNGIIDAHVAEAIEGFAESASSEQERRLGRRLGFLAHELRNALSSATLAFGALERGQVGARGPTADVVRRSFRRMETLIDQTLATARAGSALKPGLHEVALAPLLRDVASAAVLERGIGLSIDADESLRVLADEHLLTTAISNLVQNAIKFSHDQVQVALRARSEGDHVAIEVEDECGGLPDGKREELFHPFVQGRVDRRGVGLGLTITREAVQALAGEVGVRDLPGKGCVFSMKLPRARTPSVATTSTPHHSDARRGSQ